VGWFCLGGGCNSAADGDQRADFEILVLVGVRVPVLGVASCAVSEQRIQERVLLDGGERGEVEDAVCRH
jgi:hypothetical protein